MSKLFSLIFESTFRYQCLRYRMLTVFHLSEALKSGQNLTICNSM